MRRVRAATRTSLSRATKMPSSRSSRPIARTSSASSWHRLQSQFVDDPRETVSEADSLVAELLQELARGFSDARGKLESQWSEGDDVSTEDLRISLKRYRSFFERLLSV